jgi:cytochrome c peroxidase
MATRLSRLWFLVVAVLVAPAYSAEFQLTEQCPSGFERIADGKCYLRSLYNSYKSVEGHGGVQAALPAVREGFTPQTIDLGRHLFFDPLLSGDRKTSCAHCHHPDHGFTDGLATAAGFGAQGFGSQRKGGVSLTRRTPTLWNIGFATRLFWDGRAHALEEQAEGPLFAPNEMGNTPERLQVDMNANATYRQLFAQAFNREREQPITVAEVTTALAAFESTLVSLNSRYDRYAHGDSTALKPQEIQGMNVFRGFVARCTQCHTPPLFTNHELAVVGAPAGKGLPIDAGAGAVSHDPMMRGAFKVPTLRNVTRTGPYYFNAGQMGSLKDVVAFYNAPRGHALPKREKQSIHWHVHMLSARLSAADVNSVVAFLGALEDESMTPTPPGSVPSGLPVVGTRATTPRAISP